MTIWGRLDKITLGVKEALDILPGWDVAQLAKYLPHMHDGALDLVHRITKEAGLVLYIYSSIK